MGHGYAPVAAIASLVIQLVFQLLVLIAILNPYALVSALLALISADSAIDLAMLAFSDA
jgi:uncharacterized membrane protein